MREERYWYAVQSDRDDDWGTGSYDYGEAIEMAKVSGCSLIAVIDENGNDSVCIDEFEIN